MTFKNVILGTAMLSCVRVLRLAAQFVAIPILSRLLSPAEYGLVALAMPFALFAMMIADAGIGMSLVRTPASERTVWSTCFWLSTALGALLSLVMAGIAPLAADFFDQPQLAPMIWALCFVVMAQALHLIPIAALQQAQRFRTIAIIEVGAAATGIATALYMAYHGYGAWALIGQQVGFFAVRVLVACALSPFRPLFTFRWSDTAEHVLFGRNVLGTSMVNYFARSFDNWVVGNVLGAALLGFYSMAFQFARLPAQVVAGPLQYVLYSQLARMKDDPAAIARTFLLTTRLVAILIFPAMGMVAAAHKPLFTLLLSEKWEFSGLLFMVLAPAAAAQAVLAISETAMYALGRTDVQLRAATEYTIFWIIALIIAVHFGLSRAALTYTGCTLLYQLRYLSLAMPQLGIRKRDYYSTWLIPLIATCLGIIAYNLITSSEPLDNWTQAIIAAVITLALMMLSLLLQRNYLFELHLQPGQSDVLPPRVGQPLD